MSEVWLGVDLGTTGTRCLAFDAGLHPVASAYRENPPVHRGGGIVEQEADTWFETTAATIAEVASKVGRANVRAMGITSQGITVVPVDSDGAALRPAISWLDLRGEEMLPELARHVEPDESMRRTGKPWSGKYTLPKMMWLARHEPDLLARTRWLLMPLDYLNLRLTGRAVTDHTMAAGTMAYRLATQRWDSELLRAVGVDDRLLPEVDWSGSHVGQLLPEVAQRLGLPEIPVFLGAQDQKCAAHAAGIAPDVTTLSLGTAGALESLATSVDEPAQVPRFSFLTPGVWVKEAAIATAGAAHRWFARVLADGDYRDFDALVARADAGERPLFLPYLSELGASAQREYWGTEPAGVFWGLGLDTGRADMARAVLEGISFEIDRHLRLMNDEGSCLRVFGGGSRSAVWCQLLADVTQRRVEALSCPEAAAAGAAMLAGAPGSLAAASTYEAGEAVGALVRRHDAWATLRTLIHEPGHD